MRFLNGFDKRAGQALRGLPKSFRPVMAGFSLIGEPATVLVIGFSGFVSALARGQSAIAHAFVYAVVAFGLNTLLKISLHRARPRGLIIKTLGLRSYSFPSGHAFGTVIFYGLFAYLDIKYLNHPWSYFIALLIIMALFLVGVSRVYLGTHYPTDVVGGWLLGIISLAIIKALAF